MVANNLTARLYDLQLKNSDLEQRNENQAAEAAKNQNEIRSLTEKLDNYRNVILGLQMKYDDEELKTLAETVANDRRDELEHTENVYPKLKPDDSKLRKDAKIPSSYKATDFLKTGKLKERHSKNKTDIISKKSDFTFEIERWGNIGISGVYQDHICLVNRSGKLSVDLGNAQLCQKIDKHSMLQFKLPRNLIIPPMGNLKIYAKEAGKHNPPRSIVMESLRSWGEGNVVETLLYNEHDVLKAKHVKTLKI